MDSILDEFDPAEHEPVWNRTRTTKLVRSAIRWGQMNRNKLGNAARKRTGWRAELATHKGLKTKGGK